MQVRGDKTVLAPPTSLQLLSQFGEQPCCVHKGQFSQTLGHQVPGALLLTLTVVEQQGPDRVHVGRETGAWTGTERGVLTFSSVTMKVTVMLPLPHQSPT